MICGHFALHLVCGSFYLTLLCHFLCAQTLDLTHWLLDCLQFAGLLCLTSTSNGE